MEPESDPVRTNLSPEAISAAGHGVFVSCIDSSCPSIAEKEKCRLHGRSIKLYVRDTVNQRRERGV
ncbi:hypothetical protein M514_02508 [Trichuris suis]|uniref:Uncharacterized protein n=1 Tax=Trichuris suis TaxID=68888 RepID=A0A085NFE3_9BILA|nr:hypothetical protein M513_02508 [Trichuris suis]KFD68189.1 hypothetical protein M514_02508 [Trichuris suis]